MIRNSYILKSFSWLFICLMVATCLPQDAYALTGGPSQPEVQSFSPIGVSDMVDPATGDFSYNIPLLEVGGYPINLVYNAGISMDQEASTVGLGWNINPGVINRTVKGLPDDFDGSAGEDADSISSGMNVKANWTFGLKFAPSGEMFGKDLVKLANLNPSIGLFYNNYKGFGVDLSISPSFNCGNLLGTGVTGKLGVNLSANSQSGNSLSPSLSFSHEVNKKKAWDRIVSKISDSKGVMDEKQANAIHKSMDRLAKLNPAEVGFNILSSPTSYTPTIKNEFKNTSLNASFKGTGELFGLKLGGSIPGYFVKQKLKSNYSSTPAFGSLYSHKGKSISKALHDYNREKDIPFSKDIENLALTQKTYDIYSVAGQGISGTYQLKRSDVGLVYDNENKNTSGGGSLGFELGGGNLLGLGGDIQTNFGNSKSGPWTDDFDVFNNLNYQKLGIDHPDYEPQYEHAYFKSAGEPSVVELLGGHKDEIGHAHPVAVKLDDKRDVSPLAEYSSGQTILNPIKRESREKRNQSISYLTADEAEKVGINKNILSYPLNSGIDRSVTPTELSRVNTKRKSHHMSEITALRPDGLRYVFGIPAYNNLKKEVSFNVTGNNSYCNDASVTDGTVRYDEDVDNSIDNDKGTDHYFSATTTPGYAHSFLLTSILSDDYSDLTGNGPSPDDLGSYTRINYTRTAAAYQWRTPYDDANYSKGLLSDPQDDKGSYNYGNKENWVVHSIESKTQVAEFYYNENGRRDAHGVAGENGGRSDAEDMEQLEKIVLYSRPDKFNQDQSLTPIKSVYFEYDYSLCQSVPTNDGRTSNLGSSVHFNQGGKLTLKKLYFKYGNSQKGRFSPYSFEYNGLNPCYNVSAYNKWSTYSPVNLEARDTTNCPQHSLGCNVSDDLNVIDYPYVLQTSPPNKPTAKEFADSNVSAWNLTDITLPSGAHINVMYEADDYAYVQDKPAMEMMEIVHTSQSVDRDPVSLSQPFPPLTEFPPATFNEINSMPNVPLMFLFNEKRPFNYLYFKLKNSFHADSDIEAKEKLANDYLGDIRDNGNLYFKSLTKITDTDDYEYIYGYYDLHPTNGFGVIKDNSGNYAYGYVQLKPTCAKDDDANGFNCSGIGKQEVSPISKAGWQFTRLNLPKKVSGDSDVGESSDDSAVLSMFKGFLNMFESIITFVNGGYNLKLRNKDFAKFIVKGKSWIRLYNPEQVKYAGTHRVKKISITDNWDKMAGGNHQSSTYGQEYSYNMTEGDSDKIISAGVASYEPMIAGDENPHRLPQKYDKENRLAPDDEHYLEKPFGESFFPGASIIYREVKVKNLDNLNVTFNATGYTQHEFYTSYDFPTLTSRTRIQQKRRKGNPIFKLLKVKSKDHLTVSQGYVISLNNMHGKPKSKIVYDNWGSIVSGVEYHYRNVGHSLHNQVKTIKSNGEVANAYLGIDFDMVADYRESRTKHQGGGVNLNNDNFLIGFLPIAAVVPWMMWSVDEKKFRSIVLTKVIQRQGVLAKTVAFDLGSSVETRNLYYDHETGHPIVTATFNEFEDPIFNFNYPAHWAYPGMEQAYQNIGAEFKITPAGSPGIYNLDDTDILQVGDELLFKSNGRKAWVVEVGSTTITLINKDGALTNLSGSNLIVKVIRSGHRNMASASIGSVTSLRNPVQNSNNVFVGSLVQNRDGKVINASAIEYNEERLIPCSDEKVIEEVCVCDNICHADYCNHEILEYLLNDQYDLILESSGYSTTSGGFSDWIELPIEIGEQIHQAAEWLNFFKCSGSVFVKYEVSQSGDLVIKLKRGICSCQFNLRIADALQNALGDGYQTFVNEWLSQNLQWYKGTSVTSAIKTSCDSASIDIVSSFGKPNGRTDLDLSDVKIESSCFNLANCRIDRNEQCESDIGQTVNPFVLNMKGNYKPNKSYTYLAKRERSNLANADIVDIRHDGSYEGDFKPYWVSDNNGVLSTPNTDAWTWTSEITKVNQNGNELESRDPLNRYSSELLGYHDQMVTAVAANAQYNQIAFEGFEDIFYNEAMKKDDPCVRTKHFDMSPDHKFIGQNKFKAHSGDYYYLIPRGEQLSKSFKLHPCEADVSQDGNESSNDLSSVTSIDCKDCLGTFQPKQGKYVISAWVTSGLNGSTNASTYNCLNVSTNLGTLVDLAPSDTRIQGWQRLFGEFIIPDNATDLLITFKGNGSEDIGIDDIRIHPYDASFKSYVYDEHTLRFTYELDENNYFTKYEYDMSGNLERVKKETERGIMMIQESRFGQQKKIN